MKKNRIAIIGSCCVLAVGSLLLGCAKDAPTYPPAKPCVVDTTSSTVYVAGTDVKLDKTGRSRYYAVYWKNGREVTLTDSSTKAQAYAIAVSGTDVYVAGVVAPHATYWKNGVPVTLSESISIALAIAISGSDVYVAGNALEGEHIFAVYWKNGNRVTLSDASNNSKATSTAVAGNDVFVAGNLNLGGRSVARYWLNGEPVNLTDTTKVGEKTVDATASSIFISGVDIYVAGQQVINGGALPVRIATYWKNGTPVLLSNGIHDAGALSIFVAGDKVSVAGYERYNDISNSIAIYWHDGYSLTVSGNTGKYISYASANSVFATGANVYVAVEEVDPNEGSSLAKYWKDGCSVDLTIGETSIIGLNSIFVVEY